MSEFFQDFKNFLDFFNFFGMEILDIPKSASNLKRLGVSAVRSPRIGLISNQKCFKNHVPSHHTLIQIAIHISKNICIANYVNEVHQNFSWKNFQNHNKIFQWTDNIKWENWWENILNFSSWHFHHLTPTATPLRRVLIDFYVNGRCFIEI